MKKTLSLLLAAAMTLSLLAGCGSKHNNDASQSAGWAPALPPPASPSRGWRKPA